MTVTYPNTSASNAPTEDGEKTKQPTNNPPTKKTKIEVKAAAKKTGPSKNAPQDNESDSEPAITIKLYFDMQATKDYPACTSTVSPLIAEPSIKPGAELKIPISIASCNPKGGEGKLFLSGNKMLGVMVRLKQRQSAQLFAVILGSLIIAVLMCVACATIVSAEGHEMSDSMAPVSWDFSASWASNITAFGTAFSFLLSVSIFPDKLLLASKGEYQLTTFFAAALAALAPAIYKLTSPSTVINSANGPIISTTGFVSGFIMASAFTIWGALLQTALELMIIFELARAGTIYLPVVIVLGVCIGIAGILLIAYCWKNLQSIIATNSTRSGRPAAAPRSRFRLDALNIGTVRERKAALL